MLLTDIVIGSWEFSLICNLLRRSVYYLFYLLFLLGLKRYLAFVGMRVFCVWVHSFMMISSLITFLGSLAEPNEVDSGSND